MSQGKSRLGECESPTTSEQSSSVSIVSDELIKSINEAHGVATMAAKNALTYAMKCGKLLAAVRETVPHGGWAKWLAANCPDISDRTDRRYRHFHECRERIETSKEPILTISDARDYLAEESSAKRTGGAEFDLEGQTFLGFMREQETQVNSMLSEIAADHERIDVIMGEMAAETDRMVESMRESIPAGLTVDAIETRAVETVADTVDDAALVDMVRDDWRRLTSRYEGMSLTWLHQAKIATILERMVTAFSVGVFQHDCTPDELETYSEWSQEIDER